MKPPPKLPKKPIRSDLDKDLPAKSQSISASPIRPEEYEVTKKSFTIETRIAPCMSLATTIPVKVRGISLTIYVAMSPWGVKDAMDMGHGTLDIDTVIRDLTERLEVV